MDSTAKNRIKHAKFEARRSITLSRDKSMQRKFPCIRLAVCSAFD
jgi:hypothetical protein